MMPSLCDALELEFAATTPMDVQERVLVDWQVHDLTCIGPNVALRLRHVHNAGRLVWSPV